MSFTLYPHQSEFVIELSQSVAAQKSVIGCAATGFGKSKVFISIALRAINKQKTVLILTESKKIYRQIKNEVPSVIDINASSQTTFIHRNKIYLAMAQTLAKRAKLIAQFHNIGSDLLILNDEAHIGTATKLLLQLKEALLIGFTATPAAKWAKHLPVIYKGIVVGKQPEWLINNTNPDTRLSYLTPYKHFMRTIKGLDGLKKGRDGDFTEASQERVFDKKDAHRVLIADLALISYTKAMIYCASINSAEALSQVLTAAGYRNTCQHSRYSSTIEGQPFRSEATQCFELAQFKSLDSGINICVSVASMTKGFDYPPIDLIMLWRDTLSLCLYNQMLGRAARALAGKSIWYCYDYGRNGTRHQRWDYPHRWQDLWNDPKKTGDGVAPMKECPECTYLLHASATVCPNCGYQFPKTEAKELTGEVETVELTKQAPITPPELIGRRLSELSAIELANWAANTGRKPYAIRVAKSQEQDNAGYLKIFGQALGYKQGWYYLHCPKITDNKIEFKDLVI